MKHAQKILTLGLLLSGTILCLPVLGAPSATPVPGPAVSIAPVGMTKNESIACGAHGTSSPCLLPAATSTLVLQANPNRGQCLLVNEDTIAVLCVHGVWPASTSRHEIPLKPATSATAYDGGSYSCSQGPGIWRGAITCYAVSATGTISVSAGSVP